MTTNYLKQDNQCVQFISNGHTVYVYFIEAGEVVQAKRVLVPVGRSIYKKLVAKGFLPVAPVYRKVKVA